MKTGGKIAVVIGGVAVVGLGVGAYFMFRKTGEEIEAMSVNPADVVPVQSTGGIPVLSSFPITDIGTPVDAPNTGLTSIGISNRPSANGIPKTGIARITGGKYAGTFDIKGTWIDANGNVGAVYVSPEQLPLDPSILTGTGSRRYDKTMKETGVNVQILG